MSKKENSSITTKIGKVMKKIAKPLKILKTISIIIAVIGLAAHAYSMTNHFKNASILAINDKTVSVQIGEVNNDPIISEIKKRNNFNYQVGDTIYVNNKGNKIYYHLTPEKNEIISNASIFLIVGPIFLWLAILYIAMIVVCLVVFLIVLPNTLIKQNKLYIIPIICVLSGLIILCLFTGGEHANTWIAIGDALILIPFLVACFLSIKKRK